MGEGEMERPERTFAGRIAAAVADVPEQRKLPGGELRADLVRPAGVQADADERQRVCFSQHAVGERRLAHAAAHPLDDVGLVFRAVVKQQVSQGLLSKNIRRTPSEFQ